MLIELYNCLARQKGDPGQAAEALVTTWRIVHLLLRLFYINKLSDKTVIVVNPQEWE